MHTHTLLFIVGKENMQHTHAHMCAHAHTHTHTQSCGFQYQAVGLCYRSNSIINRSILFLSESKRVLCYILIVNGRLYSSRTWINHAVSLIHIHIFHMQIMFSPRVTTTYDKSKWEHSLERFYVSSSWFPPALS